MQELVSPVQEILDPSPILNKPLFEISDIYQ